MRPLDVFPHEIELAHSVEARRAARFARDLANSPSGAMPVRLAATACAAVVGAVPALACDGTAPDYQSDEARHARSAGERLDAFMATLPEVGHD